MKGKVAATNGLGSGVDIAMRYGARRNAGLEVEARLHHDRGAIPGPQGDAQGEARPTWSSACCRSPTIRSSTFRQAAVHHPIGARSPSPLSFWAARKGFIDKNRAALVDLLEDYGTVLRWYYDPANHKEAVALTAGLLKRPPAAFDAWLFTKRDFFRDPDGKPDLKVVQASIDKVKERRLHQADHWTWRNSPISAWSRKRPSADAKARICPPDPPDRLPATSTGTLGAASPRPGPCSFGRATWPVRRPFLAALARSLECAATIMQSPGGRSNASQAAR